jgi:curved DNA-binding protein
MGGIDMDDLGSMFEAFFGGRGGPGFAGAGGPSGARARARKTRGRAPEPEVEHELSITFMTAARGGTERLRLSEDGKTQTLEVTIPKGIGDGTRLRVGEVVLRVRVGHHPMFRRSEARDGAEQGLDLYLDLPLTFAEASLGAKVTVPTLDEMVELSIPPGTPSGRKLRIKGRGLEDARKARGDFFVIVGVVSPDGATLSAEDAAHLRRIAEGGASARSGPEWSRPPA